MSLLVLHFLIFFSSFYPITRVHVNLPNGSTVIIKHTGNISLCSQFYLTNVLYSPSFKLNLIYVAKLYHSLSCTLQFMSNQCNIHDSTSLEMSGLASQLDGLYKFHASSITPTNIHSSSISKSCNLSVPRNSSNVIPNKVIWHFRKK